jgi:hypothetical protein
MRAHNDRIALVVNVRWRPADWQANRVELRGWHDKRLVSRAFRIGRERVCARHISERVTNATPRTTIRAASAIDD